MIKDLTKVGARGGGFATRAGTTTEVSVSPAKTNQVHVSINGRPAPEAATTIHAVEIMQQRIAKPYIVTVKHKVDVPIGSGFGTSAGGALTSCMALTAALGLHLTYNQIGMIAHIAEIECKTGLGTVGPLMLGGCILTVEPGGPGVAVIDRIPLKQNHLIIAGVFSLTPTKSVLSSATKRTLINEMGKQAMQEIIEDPSVENFLSSSMRFAEKTGFATNRVKTLAKKAEKAGAIGTAQNMVGEAIHALVEEDNASRVVDAFKQVLPNESIIISKIDFQGARLVSNEEI